MKKLFTVVGARPQFIKAAAISRCLVKSFPDIKESIIHTNQHFDASMSQVFFDELGIPAPSVKFEKNANYEARIGQMIDQLTNLFDKEKPNAVLVYGDTNSTFAAASAATALHIPVFHIEAGLRSYNKSMPEEVNRIFTDHVSTLMFCPTQTAVKNLIHEGFKVQQHERFTKDNPGIFLTGDVMLDNLVHFREHNSASITQLFNLENKRFALLTLHRPQNADNPERLNTIVENILVATKRLDFDLVFPVHPRTKQTFERLSPQLWSALHDDSRVHITEPLSYNQIIGLTAASQLVFTDSGGLQKEAHFLNKPVVILRNETEWVEIIQDGNGILVDADSSRMQQIPDWFLNEASRKFNPHFGDGDAASKICQIINQFFQDNP